MGRAKRNPSLVQDRDDGFCEELYPSYDLGRISTTPETNSSTSTIFRNVASSIRPYNFKPSQVPASSAGSPIANSFAVSAVIAPLPPIHSALIRKIATATG